MHLRVLVSLFGVFSFLDAFRQRGGKVSEERAYNIIRASWNTVICCILSPVSIAAHKRRRKPREDGDIFETPRTSTDGTAQSKATGLYINTAIRYYWLLLFVVVVWGGDIEFASVLLVL